MALLRLGELLESDVTGETYRVASRVVDRGGFGEVYRARLSGSSLPDVCIKAMTLPTVWHGEAYFGRLLAGNASVVQLLDAFPATSRRSRRSATRYLLVFEWMQEGTVADLLSGPRIHWSEARTFSAVTRLLKVLALLHDRGICHGDITPRNVYHRNGQLVLGDFGLVTQSLTRGPVTMPGAAPSLYIPRWPEIKRTDFGFTWTASADVYQVALIALSLLSGLQANTDDDVRTNLLRLAPLTDYTKGWLLTAFGLGSSRYRDAGEALRYFTSSPVGASRPPNTLRGARIVFTGYLDGMVRKTATRRAKRAGALVQKDVNNQTTVVVKGRANTLYVGEKAGMKLIEAQHRIVNGQRIAIIDEKRFVSLLRKR